jgi:hypothetical protein
MVAAWSRPWMRLRRGRARPLELPQAPVPSAIPAVEVVANWGLAIIVLMILLSRIEGRGGDDLGDDRPVKSSGRLELPLGLFRQAMLRRVMIEDGAAIVGAVVAKVNHISKPRIRRLNGW